MTSDQVARIVDIQRDYRKRLRTAAEDYEREKAQMLQDFEERMQIELRLQGALDSETPEIGDAVVITHGPDAGETGTLYSVGTPALLAWVQANKRFYWAKQEHVAKLRQPGAESHV